MNFWRTMYENCNIKGSKMTRKELLQQRVYTSTRNIVEIADQIARRPKPSLFGDSYSILGYDMRELQGRLALLRQYEQNLFDYQEMEKSATAVLQNRLEIPSSKE